VNDEKSELSRLIEPASSSSLVAHPARTTDRIKMDRLFTGSILSVQSGHPQATGICKAGLRTASHGLRNRETYQNPKKTIEDGLLRPRPRLAHSTLVSKVPGMYSGNGSRQWRSSKAVWPLGKSVFFPFFVNCQGRLTISEPDWLRKQPVPDGFGQSRLPKHVAFAANSSIRNTDYLQSSRKNWRMPVDQHVLGI